MRHFLWPLIVYSLITVAHADPLVVPTGVSVNPDGTVSIIPSMNGNASVADKFSVSGNLDGSTYCTSSIPYGSNSHASQICGQTTAAVTTSPVTILTTPKDGADLEVCGLSSSIKFCDKIQANLANGGVIYTDTGTGSPAARTYAFPGSGVVNLTMASGTYSINTFGTVAGTR